MRSVQPPTKRLTIRTQITPYLLGEILPKLTNIGVSILRFGVEGLPLDCEDIARFLSK